MKNKANYYDYFDFSLKGDSLFMFDDTNADNFEENAKDNNL